MGKMASSIVSLSIAYKFIERFGTQLVNVVLNIILARLLTPGDYGTLAILNVFIMLAQVVSQNGINNALIQKVDVDKDDYSTGFVISLIITVALYIFIFISAPFIAAFYDISDLTVYLRVIALSLFPGAVNTIFNARIMREMRFKIVMITGIISSIGSCVIGVLMAYMGFGVWALICQQMSGSFILLFMFVLMLKWRIGLKYKKDRAKVLFDYGYKIITASVIDNLYYDFESLFIGKVMSKEMLGFYSNARTYPLRVISSIRESIAGVIFPAMANVQDNNLRIKELTRKSIQLFSFVVFPLMIGFSLIAKEFILVFLTEKWLISLFPMRMFSIGLAFLSLSAPNIQIIKAKGMGELYLKIECIRKGVIFIMLVTTAIYWETIEAISIGSMVSTIITAVYIMQVCGNTVGYNAFYQIKDISNNIICVFVMAVTILALDVTVDSNIILVVLLLKVFVGAFIYFLCAIIIKNPMLTEILIKGKSLFKV